MNQKGIEDIDMTEVEIKSAFDKIDDAVEELKTKYKKRWRGRDGRWHYEYAQGPKKPSTGKEPEKESLSRNELSKEADKQGLEGNDAVGYIEDRMDGLSSSEALDNVRDRKQSDKKPKKESGSKQDVKQAIVMSIDSDVSAEVLAETFTPEQLRQASESPMGDKKKVTQARLLQEKKPKKKSIEELFQIATKANMTIAETDKLLSSFGQKAIEKNMRCKSMTEEEKVGSTQEPEAQAPAPDETEQKAADKVDSEEDEKEDSKEDEKEGKSFTLKDLKSTLDTLSEQVKSLKTENADLKAVFEKAQHKSKGAESNEQKSQSNQEKKSLGPLDMI